MGLFQRPDVFTHSFLHDDGGKSSPHKFPRVSLSLAAAGIGPELDPIVDRIFTLKGNHRDFWIEPAYLFFKRLGIFHLGERAELESIIEPVADPQDFLGRVDYFDANRNRAGSNHTQSVGCGIGEVDDPLLDEGTAVVDRDLYGSPVDEIGHHDPRAERQSLMRGGKLMLIVKGAAGRGPAMESGPVPRSDPGLARSAHARWRSRQFDLCRG